MKYTLRLAVEADYQRIVTLVRQVHDLHVEHRPEFYRNVQTPLGVDFFKELLQDPKHTFYVYEDEATKEIVAYTVMVSVVIENNPIMKDNRIWMMDALCVDASARRSGIGKSLMTEIERIGRESGYSSLELNVWAFNAEAIAFYKRCGLTEKTIRMEKKL